MFIIPAIDIIVGKCVRLTQGDYAQKKIYNDDPLEVAKEFEGYGIEWLHLVDLDGAKSEHIVNYKVLEKITKNTKLQVDFGGGIKSDEDIKLAFDSGAHQITAGSIAVKSRETVLRWLQQFGAEKIIIGADVRDEYIAVSGWQEKSSVNLFDLIGDYVEHGAVNFICTDISRDGMLAGPAFKLYEKILDRFPELNLIASGGISSMDDVERLEEMGLYGAIIGKALYEGKIDLNKLVKR
jgi:phosphoribosylformimino-5-aminoimidazole carboxamide ribotide isomerase